MDFTSVQLDQIATHLENKSGDPRTYGEDNTRRILSALQTLTGDKDMSGDLEEKITRNIITVIDKMINGEGGNIEALNVTANGTYTATGDVAGYSPVTVNVEGGGDKYPEYDGDYKVTPKTTAQKLSTEQRSMEQDVDVEAIAYNVVTNPEGGQTATIGTV